jgi:ribosomal protein S18 acetylase RimI-like enzyme
MELDIRPFKPVDEDAVVRLWKDCGLIVAWNDPHRDIERKMKVQPQMFLVGCIDGKIVATVMGGYDGHRGWINYLAVQADYRHGGIGRYMIQEVENRLRAMGCPKINIQVRGSNTVVLEFYKRIGYKPDDVVSLGKRLEADT